MIKFIKQFPKFTLVGILGALIYLSTSFILTDYFGVYYINSSIVGFVLSTLFAYIINRFWTFGDNSEKKVFDKLVRFFIVSIFALIINLCSLYVLTEYYSIYYLFSQIFAILISALINFSGHRFWTFK
jgi:putative flippase GtrA